MKKFAALISLTIFQSQSFAYWEEVGTMGSGETTFYIDRSTIRKNNLLRRIWTLSDNKTPLNQGARSGSTLMEIDCGNEKYRFLQMTAFSGQMAYGKEIVRSNEVSDWSYIAPGTITAKIGGIACSHP